MVGSNLQDIYQSFTKAINCNHPKRNDTQQSPVGWCSWYAYYAGVSASDIEQNIRCMTGENKNIEWVLLDDGYQAYMEIG